MLFLEFYKRVKACFIQNVLRSTWLHANKTTKKCIQFLNKSSLGMLYGRHLDLVNHH